jgi:hypothetical protein
MNDKVSRTWLWMPRLRLQCFTGSVDFSLNIEAGGHPMERKPRQHTNTPAEKLNSNSSTEPEAQQTEPKNSGESLISTLFESSVGELAAITLVWRRHQLPEVLRGIRFNCDGLFEHATPAQTAVYRDRRREHTRRLTQMIEEGSNDQTVIQEARLFYGQCRQMPRVPPPPSTPESEIERVAHDLRNGNYFQPPYNGSELDSIKELLSREPPGTRIASFTLTSITFSSGRIVTRKELRDALVPVGAGKLDKIYGNYPRPESYEGTELGRIPPDQRIQVTRE